MGKEGNGTLVVRLELRGERITASAISGVLRMLGHCTDDVSMRGFTGPSAFTFAIRDRDSTAFTLGVLEAPWVFRNSLPHPLIPFAT